MAINKIKISNFKSFKNLDIELGKFNILIGANASGKSNFIQIFKFLRDIEDFGLDNAISLQGGIEYVRNINITHAESLSIEIVFDYKTTWNSPKPFIIVEANKAIYKFSIQFKKKGQGYEISDDKLILEGEVFEVQKKEKKLVGAARISVSNEKRRIKINFVSPDALSLKEDEILPLFFQLFPPLKQILKEQKLKPKDLLLVKPTLITFLSPFQLNAIDVSIYDFDPKLPKKAASITGKADLEENASNFAIVLNNLIKDKEQRRKFFNLITNLLPFIVDVNIEKSADKKMFFKVKEHYSKKYLPASFISDGTINIAAMIIALYFEKQSITIIEEPDKNIHPYLISKLVEMMEDASQKKQIVITTHNPELVKHANIKYLLLIDRDKEGFSRIIKPIEKEDVKIFLKNEICIDELYVQNLLGI